MPAAPAYAELHCLSNFSFLRGASHAEELIAQAQGARLHRARHHRRMFARRRGARALGGEEGRRHQTTHRRGVHARLRAAPGDHRAQPRRLRPAVAAHHARTAQGAEGQLFARRAPTSKSSSAMARAGERAWHAGAVAAAARAGSGRAGRVDRPHLRRPRLDRGGAHARWPRSRTAGAVRARWAQHCGLPLTAAGDVHMHVRARRRLQDALTAVRHGVTVAEAGAAAASQWRAAPARARAARQALSTRAAGRNREDRRARELLARRAALRISARAGAGRAKRRLRTCASSRKPARAGAGRRASPRRCARRSTTSSRSSPICATSPTSSPCTTS